MENYTKNQVQIITTTITGSSFWLFGVFTYFGKKAVAILDNIRFRVNALVKKYKTRDPFQLAQYLDITIIRFPFKKIKGLLINFFGTKIIGLNSQLPYELQRIVVAHEIGHDQLHVQDVGYFFIAIKTHFVLGKYERQANKFAAELLLGEDRPYYGEGSENFARRKRVTAELVNFLDE